MLPTSPVLASAPYPLVLSPGTNSLQGPLRGSDLAPTHLLRPAGPLGTPAGMWEGSGAPGTVGQQLWGWSAASGRAAHTVITSPNPELVQLKPGCRGQWGLGEVPLGRNTGIRRNQSSCQGYRPGAYPVITAVGRGQEAGRGDGLRLASLQLGNTHGCLRPCLF